MTSKKIDKRSQGVDVGGGRKLYSESMGEAMQQYEVEPVTLKKTVWLPNYIPRWDHAYRIVVAVLDLEELGFRIVSECDVDQAIDAATEFEDDETYAERREFFEDLLSKVHFDYD